MPFDALDPQRLREMRRMAERMVARVESISLRPGSKWYLLESVLWGKVQWQLQRCDGMGG